MSGGLLPGAATRWSPSDDVADGPGGESPCTGAGNPPFHRGAAASLLLLAGLDELGAFGNLGPREPLYTILVVLGFGAAFAGIGLAFVALLANVKLASDWRLALEPGFTPRVQRSFSSTCG